MNSAPWSWTAHLINTSLVTYVKSHGPDILASHVPSSFWAFPARLGVWLWLGVSQLTHSALGTLRWGVPGIRCWGTLWRPPQILTLPKVTEGGKAGTSRKVANIRTLVISIFISGRHKETGTHYVNNAETQSVDAQSITCATNLHILHLTSPMQGFLI